MTLQRFRVWRFNRRSTTVEIVHAATILLARAIFANYYGLDMIEVEAEQA